MRKKTIFIVASVAGMAALTVIFIFAVLRIFQVGYLAPAPPNIKVGILHSLTGPMAESEKPVVDATLLAIDELNAQGGVLGRKIEAIIADGASDPNIFAAKAASLILDDGVKTIFGCWTSASRKTVAAVCEENDCLLIYPVQSEGMEESPNVVYTGAMPNQQIVPAVKWCFDKMGPRAFLVGSDYVFPRAANAIIKDQIHVLNGRVVGERYLPLAVTADTPKLVADVVAEIVKTNPDFILNTINGAANVLFFKELRKARVESRRTPTMSFSIGENELSEIGPRNAVGDYACWSYFQSINSIQNETFVDKFREKHGGDRVVGDPMETAYVGVRLWAQAVETARDVNAAAIRRGIAGQSILAPEGVFHIDEKSLHAWRIVRIGRIMSNGQFAVVWNSQKPIHPQPFPVYRSPVEWSQMLDALFKSWNGNWFNPKK